MILLKLLFIAVNLYCLREIQDQWTMFSHEPDKDDELVTT